MEEHQVNGVSRSPIWFAGYVLGFITKNSTSVPYPPPPFDEDGVPEDKDLKEAIEFWKSDSRLWNTVQDGRLVGDLPPLGWLRSEQHVSSCFVVHALIPVFITSSYILAKVVMPERQRS